MDVTANLRPSNDAPDTYARYGESVDSQSTCSSDDDEDWDPAALNVTYDDSYFEGAGPWPAEKAFYSSADEDEDDDPDLDFKTSNSSESCHCKQINNRYV
jgi:hypothetical protein